VVPEASRQGDESEAAKMFPALSLQAFDFNQFVVVVIIDLKRADYSVAGNEALQKRGRKADAASIACCADDLIDLTLIVPQILIGRYIKIKN
jgi:hypothetical protein